MLRANDWLIGLSQSGRAKPHHIICSQDIHDPLFLSDGYANYLTAIVTHFGHWVQPPRRQAKGPAPKPR